MAVLHKSRRLLRAARRLAADHGNFQIALGPGAGDHASNAFVKNLRDWAVRAFGADFSEQPLCGDTAQKVDYYFPSEATIVEVALGLPNPASEFEKDILKAVLAKEQGHKIERLMFISRAGARGKCKQPGRASVAGWLREHYAIKVEVFELAGEQRKRTRRRPKGADRVA